MEVKTELGKTYTVVSTAGGSVTTQDGTPVKTLTAGQDYFTAVSSVTVISDDEAIVQEVFKSAPIGGSGGGGGGTPGAPGADGEDGISCTHSWDGTILTVTSASGTSSADLKGEKGDTGPQGPQGEPGSGADIAFDDTPTEGSTNAVTSGGVWTAMLHSDGAGGIKIGQNPSTSASYNIAIGDQAVAAGSATAVGYKASAAVNCTAVGYSGRANEFASVAVGLTSAGWGSVALGYSAYSNFRQCCSMGYEGQSNANYSTTIGSSAKSQKPFSTALGYNAYTDAQYSTALGCYASNSTENSIVLSARSSANTKFVLSLIAGTATGEAGSILSDTPFMTGSTLKLTVYDGVSGIAETLSIDAATLFTLFQSAGGTIDLVVPDSEA